jgi:hypothetical protein
MVDVCEEREGLGEYRGGCGRHAFHWMMMVGEEAKQRGSDHDRLGLSVRWAR